MGELQEHHQVGRDETKNAKAHLESSLSNDRTTSRASTSTSAAKRKPGKMYGLLNQMGVLGKEDREKGRITECLLSFSVNC